jgi:phenylacetate-CoA ligase
MYRWQGLQPSDVIQSVYGHGMINGGHYIGEAVTHFTNSLFLSAGTGIETRSVNQVQLMADFGVTVLVGFIDYIRKLAETARDEGLLDRINIKMICGHLGTEDRSGVEQAWGGARLSIGMALATPARSPARGRSGMVSMSGKTRNI